jgi:hypothetical protein
MELTAMRFPIQCQARVPNFSGFHRPETQRKNSMTPSSTPGTTTTIDPKSLMYQWQLPYAHSWNIARQNLSRAWVPSLALYVDVSGIDMMSRNQAIEATYWLRFP